MSENEKVESDHHMDSNTKYTILALGGIIIITVGICAVYLCCSSNSNSSQKKKKVGTSTEKLFEENDAVSTTTEDFGNDNLANIEAHSNQNYSSNHKTSESKNASHVSNCNDLKRKLKNRKRKVHQKTVPSTA